MDTESPTGKKTAKQGLQRPPQAHFADERHNGEQQGQREAGHECEGQWQDLLS
jgi:hypothetical protein